MALRERPDLILMDLEMPRMSGLEACRALKQHANTKHIPVILLTMRGEKQFVEEGYSSGCSDYLTKPLNEETLLKVLKEHLGE
jgi:CheY-like chemotaxis protein